MDAHDVHVASSSANNSVSLALDALQCAGWVIRNKHHMKPHTVHAKRSMDVLSSPSHADDGVGSVCLSSVRLPPALAAEDTWSVRTLSWSCRCREKTAAAMSTRD